jgi:hypothetical protein
MEPWLEKLFGFSPSSCAIWIWAWPRWNFLRLVHNDNVHSKSHVLLCTDKILRWAELLQPDFQEVTQKWLHISTREKSQLAVEDISREM